MDQRQTSLRSLVDKTVLNTKYIDVWFSHTLESVITTFAKTQKYPANTFQAAFAEVEFTKYSNTKVVQLTYSQESYALLLEQNFYYGLPIMACCFYGIHKHREYSNILSEWQEFDILFITLETPLKKARQIFTFEGELGNQKMVLDPMLSQNLILPPHVSRFNYIIQPDYQTTN